MSNIILTTNQQQQNYSTTLTRKNSQRLSMPSVVINSQQQKQRPIVTVLPNKQQRSVENNQEDNLILYKNKCFGMDLEIKEPPKLNLYRTSQILSECSILPKSLNGETLNSMNFKQFYLNDNPPPPPGI